MKLEQRQLQIRNSQIEKREVSGIAVPLDTKTELYRGCYEKIRGGR